MPAEPVSANRLWLAALQATAAIAATPLLTLPRRIEAGALAHGEARAILSVEACLSYGELAAHMRRTARFAKAQGWGKGDVIALHMQNGPDYLATWLGLARVGIVTALLNPQLAAAGLDHGLRVSGARAVIADASLGTEPGLPVIRLDAAWRAALNGLSGAALEEAEAETVTLGDPALLIFTSGTTGMPKAARLSHHRILTWSLWFAGLSQAGASDRLYDPLPLFHSVGGVVAPGAMLVSGGAVMLRDKFSVSQFWDDIVRFECTIFQYIGDLCRYLLNAPPHPLERAHRLRLACGNGLSGAIWEAFVARFALPRILEFYAATEGNVSLYNVEGKPGALGRIPGFLAHGFPLALVRHDAATGAPWRDADGFCRRCATDEPGEALGLVSAGRGATGAFEGYTDPEATSRKLLRDVFAPGDVWFRTGDLMRADAQGYHYFVDRIGDTFRWHGENVATTEVARVIGAVAGVKDCAVYGVTVPGHDGRAGMAALVVSDAFAMADLTAALAAHLPAYARPLFVRIMPALPLTQTFKQQKTALMNEGFDPRLIADPLWFWKADAGQWQALDAHLHDAISKDRLRL
ncbi:MAG: AMP-binding protein [Hyphomicrobiales bacterium]|nr:AMP-binding protein [Hyphomicrobiales bacterium]